MEQTSFEEAVLATLREVPEKQRLAILNIVRTMVRELKQAEPADGNGHYGIERHREIRRLTASIRGSLAAAVAAERDERG